jgi:hypothetical protein
MDVKGSKGFCDEVFVELSGIKKKLVDLKERSGKTGAEKPVIGIFERHLTELVDEIDWKLQILAHSCSYDWQGSADFEHDVQIRADEKTIDKDFSPGYVGG